MTWDAVGALVPSIGVGLLFWFAIRAMLNADRRERQAMAKYEAAERLRVAGSEDEAAATRCDPDSKDAARPEPRTPGTDENL